MGINREHLRNGTLTVLVILSFFLSYRLWTAGRTLNDESLSSQMTRTAASTVNHHQADAFRPVEVVLHGSDNEDIVLTSHTYPMRNLMNQTFENMLFDQLTRSELRGYDAYIEELSTGDWLEFIYLEELPLGIIEQTFDNLSRDAANTFFNRMLVNVNDRSQVYFYNTNTEIFHVASVVENQGINIEPFLNQDNLPYVEAIPYIVDKNIIYITTNPVDISYKSYVIDQLPNQVYINNFFPDTSLVDPRSNGNITRYIDLTKEVSINDNTETLNYLRQITEPGELDATTRYVRSFEQVNRFENWADTVVLANYNQSTETISFRRELDGIQVFSSFDYESVTDISLVESGVTHLKLPLRFIRTPIAIPETDAEGEKRQLIAGTELLEDIQNNVSLETFNNIEDITIGYTWIDSIENNQVVNFTPEWYIKISGTWVSYQDLLNQQEERAYGF